MPRLMPTLSSRPSPRSSPAQGLPITVTSAELDGENIVAKGVSIKFPDAEPSVLGDIVLESVEENDDGGYTIGTIAAPVTKIEQGTEKFEFNGASINGLHIAAEGETDPVKQMLLYELNGSRRDQS